MMRFGGRYPSNWREYQKRLRRTTRRSRLLKRLPFLFLISGCSFLALALVFYLLPRVSLQRSQASYGLPETKKKPGIRPAQLSRKDISSILKEVVKSTPELTDRLLFEKDGHRLTLKTSIEPTFQEYIERLLDNSKTLEAAAVVISPRDGRILAMGSYEAGGKERNLCLQAEFPAASLFKIVSAAAAMETAGLTPDSPVFFRGRKYTLYKSQLTDKQGRYTTKTSLRRAFAISINSVFGKLGIYQLGKEIMVEYAGKFLFNKSIPFDLPVAVSTIEVPDDRFGLAEIASGFNKRTLLSPLHAALLASAVANNGNVMAPWFVQSITDESGRVLYESHQGRLAAPISQKTASDLKALMRETIMHGTSRKAFRRLRRKRAFREVELGAKTGTINDKSDQIKYDWFTGYALPRGGAGSICIGVLCVHGERLGVRSSELASYIIDYGFTARR